MKDERHEIDSYLRRGSCRKRYVDASSSRLISAATPSYSAHPPPRIADQYRPRSAEPERVALNMINIILWSLYTRMYNMLHISFRFAHSFSVNVRSAFSSLFSDVGDTIFITLLLGAAHHLCIPPGAIVAHLLILHTYESRTVAIMTRNLSHFTIIN